MRMIPKSFSEALIDLKAGGLVCRESWAKGVFLAFQKGYPDGIAINSNTAEATGLPEGTVCRFQRYLMMRTTDGSFVPWTPSQTDILADDWEEYGDSKREKHPQDDLESLREDRRKLYALEAAADAMHEAAGRGVNVTMTNSDTPLTREIFASFKMVRIATRRDINLRSERRSCYDLVFTTY